MAHNEKHGTITYTAQQLFQFALLHLPNAGGLIETQLPEQSLVELNLDTLKLRTESFVEVDLREKFSDLLFSV